jgi:hypothetical protein
MKFLVLLALTASFLAVQVSAAQTRPDFSGIFLRTGTRTGKGQFGPAVPRILEVKQTAAEVEVIAIENGETALVHYRFESERSDSVQAKLKEDKLVLKAKFDPQFPGAGVYQQAPHVAQEDWVLSADGRILTLGWKDYDGISGVETYLREPDLQAARAGAERAAEGRVCEHPLPSPTRGNQTRPAMMDENGVELGFASFEQITFCTSYSVVLSGEFFKGLQSKQGANQTTFQKSGKVVTQYMGDLTLEVSPHSWACGGEIGTWVSGERRQIDPLERLRFMVRWLGSTEDDLGEVHSELLHQPWRENYPAEVFFRMRVPADNIPLQDNLEVVIFSEDGQQLACVRGRV